MGQIVKRKKKGRPSKADLAKRAAEEAKSDSPATESDTRRSLRRRNVKYNIDYDDYVDDEDEDEEEGDTRREKKLKLPIVDRTQSCARDCDVQESGNELDDRRTSRKTKIDDVGDRDDDEENGIDDFEEKGRHGDLKGNHSVPGTPTGLTIKVPLPDRKKLELILNKLQRKDIYGVYAEPVDPEELPDYHEIIEHPMDFATVRKKLASGSYPSLKQIESDINLICANAMQYNAPDTVYYKQARTIQELARKKFLKLRIDVQNSDKELKSEQKTIPSSFPKKQTKNAVLTSQEPLGSDFSAGPTPATVNLQNSPNVKQAGGGEKPSNGGGSIEASYSLFDKNLEKAQELISGKGLLYKFGRKPNVLDENRRATYNTTNLPIAKSDSIYTTFDGEHKQLVAVGLHAEHSYARSMARFAASLGPFSWKVASKRIEQALPAGFKFGRGWVGEYEPFPSPVLMVEKHSQKETAFFNKMQSTAGLRTDDRLLNTPAPAKESFAFGSNLEGKSPGGSASSGTKPFTPTIDQHQNPSSKTHVLSANKAVKQGELNFPLTSKQNKANFAEKPFPGSPKIDALREIEVVPGKKQNIHRSVSVEFPNGKVINGNMDNKRLVSSSSDSVPNEMVRAETFSPRGQVQSLINPAQSTRLVHESAQKAQISSDNSLNDSNNAAATAARAWMSIGTRGFKPVIENLNQHRNQISADSLYNPARNHHPQMLQVRGEFLPDQNRGFVPQVRMPSEAQFQNRPTSGFPHLGATDLSRFQMQTTPWRGPSPHVQPRQKQDMFPPDLNISFQSSAASPVRQSTGVLVDSQQPDLALQL